MDLVRRLRRMSDMTTTGNDLEDIGRAADKIEILQHENRALRDGIKAAIQDGDFRLTAPCILCGFSGAGFYQPETHKCAALIDG